MEHHAQHSLEYEKTNTTTNWNNPDIGNYGSITPTETYQSPEGRYCREYLQTITIGREVGQSPQSDNTR